MLGTRIVVQLATQAIQSTDRYYCDHNDIQIMTGGHVLNGKRPPEER